jgi:E3 ubiquitin-protein ligase TRIP12
MSSDTASLHSVLSGNRNVGSKGKIAAAKSKTTTPGPSRADCDLPQTKDAHANDDHEDPNEGEMDSPDHHDHDDDDDEEDGVKDRNTTSHDTGLGHLDESTAMAIFGDYRQLSSYMLGLSGRLKSLLSNIKPSADPTTRLISLQELTELLSISTEDTLAGSFPVESYIRELVKILGGTGNADDDDDRDEDPRDHDPDLAAALVLSGGSRYQGDENPEAQVLACRCLANLMEALPGVAHTVVYHGAIPVLCSKLIEISYIDLAEQTLSVSCRPSVRGFCLMVTLSDAGENIGGIPECHRQRRRLERLTELPRLLLHRRSAHCHSGRI